MEVVKDEEAIEENNIKIKFQARKELTGYYATDCKVQQVPKRN